MTSDCLYFAGEYIPYAEIAALAMMVWQLANVGITRSQPASVAPGRDSSPRAVAVVDG